ncbi:MAG: hypothetical protein A3C38_01105 [Planctomycetes bacterium RIFCSPHIGHO2_02_FULL_50_42]|nr:MAG: hypothetical protein A3C38_01105 [Planctomycetes bacterium RIFCSPHIGHO2_02_FULL_50_42]OHB95822.1 MAG: hypothetical protein A3I59_02915 [Planctomycetes bacterium RIFCSPLOWO2_02_FULL_50_16]OHC02739.1 MAG: hypothetical protein A3G17_08365 [Planctomycetes bacterium RIFCSPLOWO2_12_FULL_50_35]HCN19275.1 hypothetical protein [Planctomycetia bacterium]
MQYFLSRDYELLYRFVPSGVRHPILIILTILLSYGGGLDIYINGPGLYTMSFGLHDTYAFCGQQFFWRPLSNLGYRLLYTAFGTDPLPYHVLDLSIHGLNALLVYYIARKLSKDSVVALVAGLMFAAFYRHSGLLFSTGLFYEHGYVLFCLLAILNFLHFQDTNKTSYLLTSLISIFIALQIKDSAMVAFPLILALDQLYRPYPLPRIRWRIILCLVGVGIVYFVLRMHFMPYLGKGASAWLDPIHGLGVFKMLKQLHKALYITISNVCPGKDMSSVFYLGFAVFLWKATKHRRLVVTTGILLVISILPLLVSSGLANRYLYLSTAFSVIFLAIIIRYTASALAVRMLSSYGDFGVGLVTGVTLLLIISFNTYKIQDYEAQYREAGCFLRSNIEDIVNTFPNGTKNFRLCLINTPIEISREDSGVQVWEGRDVNYMLSLFYEEPNSIGEVRQFTTDLGYTLPRHQERISEIISNDELDTMSRDPKNKIMVFNPYTEHMEEMTGKMSQEMRTAIENTRG